uniref:Uncharacterized protein n=1 Tax=Arundo donax TaxID=35708 RepID=A0A0A8Z0I7_ARUDO
MSVNPVYIPCILSSYFYDEGQHISHRRGLSQLCLVPNKSYRP